MKKLLGLTVAAAVLAMVPQQASAWSNIKFGVGLNFEASCGNNNLLWGTFVNGQVPGYGGGYGGYYEAPMIVPGHAYADQAQPAAPAAQPKAQNAQNMPANPYHYSSYQPGYYYQDPGYYYGQNTWYGSW